MIIFFTCLFDYFTEFAKKVPEEHAFQSFFKKNSSISCTIHKIGLTLQSQKPKRSLG